MTSSAAAASPRRAATAAGSSPDARTWLEAAVPGRGQLRLAGPGRLRLDRPATVIPPGSLADDIRLGQPAASRADIEQAAITAGLAGVIDLLPPGWAPSWVRPAGTCPRGDPPGNRDELPRHADWPALFELKRQWQVSLAALLMRAKTLGRMSDSSYLTAVKALSARGWRRVEPVPLGAPEHPAKLRQIATAKGSVCAALPRHVVSAIVGANPA